MTLPTIAQYGESISNPEGRFRTLHGLECERDLYGAPSFTAGGSGAVFKVYVDGAPKALKCFSGCRRNNMKELCDYIYEYTVDSGPSGCRTPLLYPTEWLPDEIYVFDDAGNGRWYDVMVSEWAEGATLEYEIRRALHYRDGSRLLQLAEKFEEMVLRLFDAAWAHGDLKPSNIMVENTDVMRLLDCESVIAPDIENCIATKSAYGHPNTNPIRDGKHIDDYPAVMIAATLRSLAHDPSLYDRYGTSDYFLFSPDELQTNGCAAYDEVRLSAARCGDARLYTLLEMLSSPSPQLNGLREVLAFSPGHNTVCDTLKPFVANGKWGYRTDTRTVIPAIYDNALEFREGAGVVEVGSFRHYIDPTGLLIINGSDFDTANSFSGGYARIRKGGRWFRMDRTGELIPDDNQNTTICIQHE